MNSGGLAVLDRSVGYKGQRSLKGLKWYGGEGRGYWGNRHLIGVWGQGRQYCKAAWEMKVKMSLGSQWPLGNASLSPLAAWFFLLSILAFLCASALFLLHSVSLHPLLMISPHLSFQLICAHGLPSPLFAQTFCCTTHYHQQQFSSESLCSNPRKNLIFLILLDHRSLAIVRISIS